MMAKTSDKNPPRRGMALGATTLTVLPADVEAVPIARGFKASVNGLIVDGQPPFPRWQKVGLTLRVIERGVQFAIGDFVNQLEARFGEDAAQEIDAESGWSLQTVNVYRWMADRIAPEDRRMDRLGIRHHLLVAALTPAKQRKWLADAANDGNDDGPWTVQRLAAAIKANDDAPATAWWVMVAAESAVDQAILMAQLEAQGRTAKALVRHGKSK